MVGVGAKDSPRVRRDSAGANHSRRAWNAVRRVRGWEAKSDSRVGPSRGPVWARSPIVAARPWPVR